ncbi:hypothetical protein ERJ99_035990 [Pseudomonas aeruginosa]|nr:hypothetical protein PADK2_07840 [Pseudomonas aeruginosa DK2]AKF98135.1 hypothetical protein YH69_08990 [Pseudomonas aeruginosa]EIE45328.1 hypothetical protein CF510_18998 [Pseudomonas aeruginosa PADK2_CF510]EQM90692.1 hypothetical protein L683_04395 [Pseudomonas aeruginosa WC55]KAJ16803.1 hypothetical protein M002_30360 [Pseudomonas aeruginosa ID4365]KKJ47040.1 hypothetical protein T648_18735 [Pseudomonas aeruginosa MRSN 317]OFQ86245.1 hypothetical protein HMPREF2914_07755 [Pseudomonas sp
MMALIIMIGLMVHHCRLLEVMWQSYFMLLSEKVPCRKGWVSFDITALGLVRYFQIFGNILRRVSV